MARDGPRRRATRPNDRANTSLPSAADGFCRFIHAQTLNRLPKMNLTYVNFWEYLRWITITDLILKSHRLPKRQPLVELAMMDEQNFSVVNNKNRDGEINFFVDVGHRELRFMIYD
jgi:hypothetical protein